jgi:hypothetical protein
MAIVDERGAAMKFSFGSGDRPLDGFTIKRGLGTGGFGEVYYALTDAGKEVALKHVRRHQEVERRGVSQCLNLKHANLVGIYDIREDRGGDTWIVMEYIADGSLRDVLDKYPNGLPLEETRRWFEGVTAGLGLLHDRGLVHRDLKPGNIFQDEGVVKVGDYGLSKLLSNSQCGGQTESVGTFHYTAPEVSRGSYGRAVDIYSLGVILYEMLTGDVPFDGESTQEIIMKHLTATPDWNRVPPAFRPVLEHALAKDPAHRYPNVGEFARAVASALAGEPVVEAQWVTGAGAATAGMGTAPPPASPVFTYTPTQPGFFDDEPIYQFLSGIWKSLGKWFADSRMDSASKTILLVVLAVVAYFNAAWIVPLASVAATFYAIYLGVRWLVWSPTTAGPADHGPASATGPGYSPTGYSAATPGPSPPGYAPPGYAPPGYAPPGYTPPGYTPAGYAPPGYAPPGYAPPGYTPPGYTSAGYAPPGYAATGPTLPGYAPQPVQGPPSAFAPPPGNGPSIPYAVPPAPRTKRPLRVSVRAMVQRKTIRERLRELTGSWLMAALVAAFLAAVGTLLFEGGSARGDSSRSSFPESTSPTQLVAMAARGVWLWGATTLGAWLLLTLGKLWERDAGSASHRRLAMAVAGVGLGAAVAGLANYLGLNRSPLPSANVPLLSELLPLKMHSPWIGYPLFYALMFLLLRWWREADSLRSTRFSFWNTTVDVVAAIVISQFVSVGTPGQLFLPAAISICVQLSAPWVDLETRARFREQISGDVVT